MKYEKSHDSKAVQSTAELEDLVCQVDDAMEEEHKGVQAEATNLQNTVDRLLHGLQCVSEAVTGSHT
jgi:hypothetical protein